jgi:hypothetical protein
MKLIAALSLFLLAAPAPEMRYFQFERPLVMPPQAGGQTCVTMDAGIYAHAARQLTDLRLYQGDIETPYVVHSDVPAISANENAALLNLGKTGSETSFDAEMPDGTYSDLQLDVDGHDFLATVTVSGSQTRTQTSRTTLGSFTIFDLSQQRLGRSTVLHLTDSNFHFLHFKIAGPLDPASVKGLWVSRSAISQPRYVTVAQVTSAKVIGRDLVFELTVPAHAPVDRLVFVPRDSASSFSRDVEIAILPIGRAPQNDAAEPPRPVTGAGNILRVHTLQGGHKINEEHLTVSAPQVYIDGPTKWTVTIRNHDDAPIPMASLRLEMLERNLCFNAVAGGSYTLHYGDPAIVAPVYDYSALFVLEKDPAPAQLGVEVPNPAYQPRPDLRPFTEKHPALLWVALILVIALLGLVALRSFKTTQIHPS